MVSTLLPPPRARHIPAVRRRRIFSLNLSEKPPALKEANTLTQFEYPAQPVLKKLPPGQNVALRASYAPESRQFLKTKEKPLTFVSGFVVEVNGLEPLTLCL